MSYRDVLDLWGPPLAASAAAGTVTLAFAGTVSPAVQVVAAAWGGAVSVWRCSREVSEP